MYLKSLAIENFRKFGAQDNRIEFVDAQSYQAQKKEDQFNIAPTTTLIVGKNNSGKSTIVYALENLIENKAFKANDFNFMYLRRLLEQYETVDTTPNKVETPYLKFTICIRIADNSNDLVTNLVHFMRLDDINKSELEFYIKVELENEEVFHEEVKSMVQKCQGLDFSVRFRNFLDLINDANFKTNYYDTDNNVVDKFTINKLVELKSIKANNIENEKCLSKAFSKIIEYRYKLLFEEEGNELGDKISQINRELTHLISERHTRGINASLEEIESKEKLQVLLRADLTFQKVMNNLITYEYIERDLNIPESQFGLGYTNLMMIIADLIDYMEKYPKNSFNSKVNLISIEEPETFMHPQMQEVFIKNINEAIASLLKSRDKNVNSQLIITTHSSHILNSKIHSGNTFNNINYVTIINNLTNIVNLHDDIIISKGERNLESRESDLKFLKKHIKYKVSELFFSDAIVFVEGITEDTLLKYYIEKKDKLNKHYISVFNIDGAHGLVYHDLIKLLRVPALIITDLDIKRTDAEKNNFKQITDIRKRSTTNKTIKKYNNDSDNLKNLPDKIETDNMYVAFQSKIEGIYPTSFEDAYILTNYENDMLNSVLQNMKPDIYRGIIGEEGDLSKLKQNSYKLQRKLSNNKSDFANELLYKFITNSEEALIPCLPEYIENGLSWLLNKLEN
jgi:putative ATP-dependent endonuclease of OLD family